jgi:AAA family ATP:ADP antiporter
MIAMIANLALFPCGLVLAYFSKKAESYSDKHYGWTQSLYYLMAIFVILGIFLLLIYHWMQKNVVVDPRLCEPQETRFKKKEKLSFWESLQVVLTSRYLRLLTVLVVAYGITINFIDLSYKDQVYKMMGSKQGYSQFMGYVTMMSGFINTFLMIVGGYIVRKTKWVTAASVTPLMLGITGLVFFAAVFAGSAPWFAPFLASLGILPAVVASYVGATQTLLTKGTKYTLFDATKEMAYIPLDDNLRVQGKAAVDVIGARLGKASGGYIQVILTSVFASGVSETMKMEVIRPYVFGVFILLVVAWLYAVNALSKLFEKASQEDEERRMQALLQTEEQHKELPMVDSPRQQLQPVP